MALESCLQTVFFPSQQFCDAGTAPLPPQMFPGGLQDWPVVQVKSSWVRGSWAGGPGWVPVVSQNTPYGFDAEWRASGEPPQQASVRSQ